MPIPNVNAALDKVFKESHRIFLLDVYGNNFFLVLQWIEASHISTPTSSLIEFVEIVFKGSETSSQFR